MPVTVRLTDDAARDLEEVFGLRLPAKTRRVERNTCWIG